MVLDNFDLSHQIVVITGGAGLLGKKYVEAFLEVNARVVVVDIQDTALKNLKSSIVKKYKNNIDFCQVDISKEQQIITLKEFIYNKYRKYPDILVNNAAIDAKFESNSTKNLSRLENFSLDQWNLELNVGLTGAMLCSKIFGFEMAKNHYGVILNIASDLGLIAPDQRLYRQDDLNQEQQNVKPVTYSVVKHAIIGLTKYIATYWADHGVRCNAFAPGGVFNNHSKEFEQKLSHLIPMQRMANIDEYQSAIIFLCSKASSYMNGTVLTMDGGRTVW